MEPKAYPIIDSVETLKEALNRVRAAQQIFATYTQEQVDRIFKAAAAAADMARVPLAKLAVEETGMGVVEDKILKNHLAGHSHHEPYLYRHLQVPDCPENPQRRAHQPPSPG